MGINRNSAVPITDQIATDLRLRIAEGEFTGRLPGFKALASSYGVAEMTIQAVIKDLQREGLVTTATGRGTFVSAQHDASDQPATADSELFALRRDVDEMRCRLDALERAVGTTGRD
jgi:DNA-binding GntR family transcriptional regulator